ncbi:YppG family protein [Alkalicoccobacillus plakortidis]|uniref:YppG family protein n=1 Tax=Alkalicoccobacillus plakortidis TaxID=444060 RepID=A0ABT0XFR5_9BACI|nr:YppG family protein [Alkalicoccobacillus plakortidis]MCM2674625.1 YppG family protein [Alkalicoccobacillus plakortidis]
MLHQNHDRRNPHHNWPNQGRQPYYHQGHGPVPPRRMRGGAGRPQPSSPSVSRTGFIKKAFTSEDGKFDVSRTAQTVDQVIKTVQQVSPYVRKVGSFFIR